MATQQYQQNVDNSIWVGRPSLVPGWRGLALPVLFRPDPMTEQPIGPVHEINDGYPWVYVPQRVASFTPGQQITNYYKNGRWQKTVIDGQIPKSYQFRARSIQEFSTSSCS